MTDDLPGSQMPFSEIEHVFSCPYCFEAISMLLDPSVSSQAYVEDCEVCCRPIAVRYTSDGTAVTSFGAEPLG